MTTRGLLNYMANKDRKPDICDDCSMVAYDNGIGTVGYELDYDDPDEYDKAKAGAWQAQVDCMVELGGELPDHECTATMEPDLEIQCDCGCRRN